MEIPIPEIRSFLAMLLILGFAGLVFPPSLQASAKEAYQTGRDLMNKSKYKQALAHLEKAVDRAPSNRTYHQALIETLTELRQWDRVERAAREALSVDSEAAEFQFYLGRARLARGELKSAIDPLNRALEQNSGSGKYHFYRGLTRFRLGDWRSSSWSSASDFRTALQRGYRPAQSRFMLANALLSRGLFLHRKDDDSPSGELLRESIHHYRLVLARNWKASNAFHNMGMAYLALGELDWAQQAVQEAISQEDQVPFFYDTLGMIQYRRGNHQRALTFWNRAQTLDPDYETHPFASLLSTDPLSEKIKQVRSRSS